MTTFRTFESFEIAWDDRATWTGFDSADEAQATIDGVASRSGRTGSVVRKTFEIELDPRFVELGMYQPGVSDRVVA